VFYKIILCLAFSAVMAGCGGGDDSASTSSPQSAPATSTQTTSTSTTGNKPVTAPPTPKTTTTTPATAGSTVSTPTTPVTTPPADPTTAIKSLAIAGTPATTALVGRTYAFQPTVTAPSTAYTFSVANLPAWAAFNTATGEITGTPTAAEVGTYARISITVSADGTTESIAPFSINVSESASGTTELSWSPPTENTNGTPLSNLAGYKIYYGTSPTALTLSTAVNSPTTDTYVVNNLTAGTWYFEVRAVSTTNLESAASNIASKVIS
jgi:Putative Ig domain